MPERTVKQARAAYFFENGFEQDGGYSARWVWLKFGLLSIPVYNSRARRRAVPLHDLHHIATGYLTTPKGEAQMATWELAAGVHDKWFAFVINLPALLYGLVLWPNTAIDAWRAGRSSRSLYRFEFCEELLDLSLGELKALITPKENVRDSSEPCA
ncbi:MAG: hypothetical protein AAF541_08955 [Pseudomonadota bacterium]